jgi:hypothetical protein
MVVLARHFATACVKSCIGMIFKPHVATKIVATSDVLLQPL